MLNYVKWLKSICDILTSTDTPILEVTRDEQFKEIKKKREQDSNFGEVFLWSYISRVLWEFYVAT